MGDVKQPGIDGHTSAIAGKRVWIAGHRGMVGSALCARLHQDDCKLITVDRSDLDLTRQQDVEKWVRRTKPEIVIVAAARVGGIMANARYPVEFLNDNLLIATNVIRASYEGGVEKLLFLGSSCIYPKYAEQPITEAALLTGLLEPTNEAYAVAKIAGLKLAEAYNRQYGRCFITAMPTNLYGPNDRFDINNSHVIPALIQKIHEASLAKSAEVSIWGSGKPRREFLHVRDLADACVFLLEHYSSPEHINIGSGYEVTIAELARLIAEVVGYDGRFVFDATKPDGTPRKRLDTQKLEKLGWKAPTGLFDGIADSYQSWLRGPESARGQRATSPLSSIPVALRP